jgi:hypothetical protein
MSSEVPGGRSETGRSAHSPGLLTGLAALAVAVLAVAVGLNRQPGSALDNIWAEDGTRFLTDAYDTPLYRAIFVPYSAYLQLYPRLAGAVAAALPVGRAAAVLSTAGCLAMAAAAFAVVICLRGVITRLPLRILAAVALPLLPTAGSAATADVANAHVWLDLLAVVVLFRPLGSAAGRAPVRTVETVLSWVAVLLAVGSDPQALILAPIVVARIVILVRRPGTGRADALVGEVVTAFLIVLGGGLQLASVATHSIPRSSIHPSIRELVHLYVRDVLAPLAIGSRRSLDTGSPTLRALVLGVVAVLVVTLIVSRVRFGVALALVVLSFVLWAVAPWLKWTPKLADHVGAQPNDARYTVLSAALLVLALAVCADSWLRRLPWPVIVGVAVVVAVAAGLVWAPSESLGPVRRPSWSAGVSAARTACSAPGVAASTREPVAGAPRPFGALVPCSRLR